jgi:biopolymer transport protein ExbB
MIMQAIWDFLVKGGPTMIPLGLCSVVALAVALEKFWFLRRKRILIPEVVAVVENLRHEEDVDLTLKICSKYDSAFPNIVRVALENRDLDREELKELINDRGRQEVRSLERGMGVLETVAGVAPLLGLLGTVLGILRVFNVISAVGVGQAQSLAGGIAEALITTIVGLCIGIPALVAFNYFTHRAESLVLDIEEFTAGLMLRVRRFTQVRTDHAISQ